MSSGFGVSIGTAEDARLHRLASNVAGMMAQKVPFIVAELGRDADPFMLHLYAALPKKSEGSSPSEPGRLWLRSVWREPGSAIRPTPQKRPSWADKSRSKLRIGLCARCCLF